MDFLPIALLLTAPIIFVAYMVLGGVIFRRQAISLKWPKTMDQNAFVRRVLLHLQHLGWIVEKSNTPEYTLGIRRDNRRFFVVCLPTDHALTLRSIEDHCRVLKRSRWAQALFFITADTVDTATAATAIAQKVFVINYRDMARIEEIFTSHLQKAPRDPADPQESMGR